MCKLAVNVLCMQIQGPQFFATHNCSWQSDANTVAKHHLGAVAHKTGSEFTVSIPSTAAESALADLIHAVPRLLEVVLPDTLAALLATNTVHR